MELKFYMSICPPLSACFTNPKGMAGKGRVPTTRYKKWKALAAQEAFYLNRGTRPNQPLSGVKVIVTASPRVGADIDNRFKASMDFLKDNGIIIDDGYPHVVEVAGRWDPEMDKGQMSLEVRPYDGHE